MQTNELFAPRILVVSGKGGVGKTTVSSALALVAARTGRRVCVVEVDRKGTLARVLGGRQPGYDPVELLPGIWGITITAEDALAEYLRVQYHMRRMSWLFTSTHFVDYITTAAPGLKDILVLGKIWFLEQGRDARHEFDTIIVDAPAAGHLRTFLSSPMGLSDAVRVGPIRRQSAWLNEMLTDPSRTRVHLVALAEEMPVTETVETTHALGELGLSSGIVFANAVYAELLSKSQKAVLQDIVARGRSDQLIKAGDAVGLSLDSEDLDALLGYERFLSARRSIQASHLRRLKRSLDNPIVTLPFLFSAGLDLPSIETMADVIEDEVASL
ncbi:MAG TPA: ArsA family ATPase [Actinomycetota bacterium]|jgi:anion-transporting  ArsA/GET3 family ATPase|nr:ArsA family ATPase [Actinomycetota bacterium]